MELLVMTDEINLTIDGQQMAISTGATILDAAHQAGISIPICFHERAANASAGCAWWK
jgi:NADH dehydrogenase/NADH:ubiquinone oxidoreductase subunit G